ncbi:MAG: hypothetical protein IJW50_01405 [Clostridia bacterium]|nr:hypothetical protein [Clostridia bacterium]
MNDENTIAEDQNEHAYEENDPPLAQDAPESNEAVEHGDETEVATVACDGTAVSAVSGSDSDLDCQGAGDPPEADGLELLRSELSEVRRLLEERDKHLARLERLEREYTEFATLYPEVSLASIPLDVQEAVAGGTPLAAAYALSERRRQLEQAQAAQVNHTNRMRSSGALRPTENLEFSPAEVRAMTPEEVRENLPKIMRSMQKWK